MISVVGIVYNARSSEAKKMAGDIAGLVGPGRESWMKVGGGPWGARRISEGDRPHRDGGGRRDDSADGKGGSGA